MPLLLSSLNEVVIYNKARIAVIYLVLLLLYTTKQESLLYTSYFSLLFFGRLWGGLFGVEVRIPYFLAFITMPVCVLQVLPFLFLALFRA